MHQPGQQQEIRRDSQHSNATPRDVALRQQELLHVLRWFIRLRWLFLAGLAAIVAGAYLFHLALPLEGVAAVGLGVLTYNVLFFLLHDSPPGLPPPDLGACRMEAALQVGFDLVALTVLVHLAGGAESPFRGFYVFHAIVGSVLLPRRDAWLVGLAAFVLFLLVVVLEQQGIVPHYEPSGGPADWRHQDVRLLAMVSLVFLVTLAGTISITSSIMSSLRLREHQLVSTQHALVKKSEDLEKAYATLTERQRQLVHTEKQASLGQLVAGIAHEINNPIQFIYGNMAILAEAFSDALPLLDAQSATRPDLRIARLDYPFFRKQVPILLTDMANGAARIGAIVRDLKTFARRDEGALDESVDLNDAVQSSLRLLHDMIRHLRVEEDLDPDLPRFRGNLTQLEQVVVNTVQNAAEAIGRDARGGVIRVRTRTEDGGRRVRLSVHDNGAGIPPEVRDRIFDPFFTTKQRSGGTGLGLAITYGIIQKHQGEIQVESQVGAGSAFHFLLPVDRSGAAA
ncbi:MAG TPA: ATP-binding protein [Anaeromyxobacter sp.]|nr:ATP-binding protein [Anaeromyxobacter sp.]